jgi:hypothetical protein
MYPFQGQDRIRTHSILKYPSGAQTDIFQTVTGKSNWNLDAVWITTRKDGTTDTRSTPELELEGQAASHSINFESNSGTSSQPGTYGPCSARHDSDAGN